MKLDRKEVARYLGYRQNPLSEETEELVSCCEEELKKKRSRGSLAAGFCVASFHLRAGIYSIICAIQKRCGSRL